VLGKMSHITSQEQAGSYVIAAMENRAEADTQWSKGELQAQQMASLHG
jgi:hypothetical protein